MMVSEDVIQELMAEIDQLKEENLRLQEKLACQGLSKTEECSIVSDYIVLSEEPLEIKGVLITEGTWNGDFYPAEVLEKMAKTPPEGIPLKIEHGQSSKWGDIKVGELVNWEYSPILKGIVFQARIEHPEVQELVKNRVYPAVSLFSWVEKVIENGRSIIKDAVPLEVSLTAHPAVPHAVIALSSKYLNHKGEIKTDMPEEVKEEAKQSAQSEEASELFVELPVQEDEIILTIKKEDAIEKGLLGLEIEPGIYIFLKKRKKEDKEVPKYYPYPYPYPYYPYYFYYPYGYYPYGYYPYKYPYPYPPYRYPYPYPKADGKELEEVALEQTPSETPPAQPKPEVQPTIDFTPLLNSIEELKREITSLRGEIADLKPKVQSPQPSESRPLTPGEVIVRTYRR